MRDSHIIVQIYTWHYIVNPPGYLWNIGKEADDHKDKWKCKDDQQVASYDHHLKSCIIICYVMTRTHQVMVMITRTIESSKMISMLRVMTVIWKAMICYVDTMKNCKTNIQQVHMDDADGDNANIISKLWVVFGEGQRKEKQTIELQPSSEKFIS